MSDKNRLTRLSNDSGDKKPSAPVNLKSTLPDLLGTFKNIRSTYFNESVVETDLVSKDVYSPSVFSSSCSTAVSSSSSHGQQEHSSSIFKNKYLMLYLLKNVFFHGISIVVVCYINTSLLSLQEIFMDSFMLTLKCFMATFVYQNILSVFIVTKGVVSNNNYQIITHLISNVVLCVVELCFYGFILVVQIPSLRQMVPQLESIARANYPSAEMGFTSIIINEVCVKPKIAIIILSFLLVLSLILELVLFLYYVCDYNYIQLLLKRLTVSDSKSNLESESDTILSSNFDLGSFEESFVNKLGNGKFKISLLYICCLYGPTMFIEILVDFSQNTALSGLSVVSLLFTIFQFASTLFPKDLQKKPEICLFNLLIIVFNFLVVILMLGQQSMQHYKGYAVFSALSALIYLICTLFYFCLEINQAFKEEDEDFYSEIDVKYLTSQIREKRGVLISLTIGVSVISNAIMFGFYFAHGYNYQWALVCLVNIIYLPAIVIFLSIDERNFNNYIAIMVLQVILAITLILNFCVIHLHIQTHTAFYSILEVVMSIGIFACAVVMAASSYAFTILWQRHTTYVKFVNRFLKFDYNEIYDLDIAIPIGNLVDWLTPVCVVGGYVGVVFATLLINYELDNMRFQLTMRPIALPYAYLGFTWIIMLIGFAPKRWFRSRSAWVFPCIIMSLFALLASVTLDCYFVIQRICLVGLFYSGSPGTEVRNQIGIGTLSATTKFAALLLIGKIIFYHIKNFKTT